jgi:hypothetical protein
MTEIIPPPRSVLASELRAIIEHLSVPLGIPILIRTAPDGGFKLEWRMPDGRDCSFTGRFEEKPPERTFQIWGKA